MFSQRETFKIKTVWYHADPQQFMASPLQYVDSIQRYQGGIFYINKEAAEFLERQNPIILLKYAIPEAEQEKITKLYMETKGINSSVSGIEDSFCATSDILPLDIINFDYYAGYCTFTKIDNKNTYEFVSCSQVSKDTWLKEHSIEGSQCCTLF